MRDHPFKNTPQWQQQYGADGIGHEGNGLGYVEGVDPVPFIESGGIYRAHATKTLRKREKGQQLGQIMDAQDQNKVDHRLVYDGDRPVLDKWRQPQSRDWTSRLKDTV